MKTSNIVITVLIGIVAVLVLVLILRKPVQVVEKPDETFLQERLKQEQAKVQYWEYQSKYWQNVAGHAIHTSDSLKALPPKIKRIYEDTYKTIHTGTAVQLDSIIRSNW
jgi:hypothetical protein